MTEKNDKLVKLFVNEYNDDSDNGCVYYVDADDEEGFFVANSLVHNLNEFQNDPKIPYILVPEWKAVDLEAEFGTDRVSYEEYHKGE